MTVTELSKDPIVAVELRRVTEISVRCGYDIVMTRDPTATLDSLSGWMRSTFAGAVVDGALNPDIAAAIWRLRRALRRTFGIRIRLFVVFRPCNLDKGAISQVAAAIGSASSR
jgi:hypothetical protein